MKVRRGNNAIGFMFGFLLRAGAGQGCLDRVCLRQRAFKTRVFKTEGV